MDVGSPDQDGLNKTSEYLKNDESYVPEELDIDFLINKDIADNYFYDDFATNYKFQLDVSEQQQQEPPSFSSDFRYCDISGSASENFHSSQTVCHGDVLDETGLVYNQEKLQSESQENHQLGEAENYLRESGFKVDLDTIHHEMENNSSTYMQKIAAKKDPNLDESMQNSSSSSHHDKMGENTFAEKLQHEGTQSEFADREMEEAFLVLERESLHLSPGSLLGDAKREELYDSRNSPANSKELEFSHLDPQNLESTPQLSISPGTREMSIQHEMSTRASHSPESTTSEQQCRDKSYSGRSQEKRHSSSKWSEPSKQVLFEDHSAYAGKEDLASLQMSSQKSQHINGSSGRYDTNHRKIDRSMSYSPLRPKNSSLTSKRKHSRSCSRSPHKNFYEKRSIDIDPSGHHSPIKKRICSSQNSEESFKEPSSSRSCRQKHDSTERSGLGKEVACNDPILCANRRNPASPRGLQQRSTNRPLRHAPTPPIYRHSHLNHQIRERPRSASPARQREFSSGHKRDHRKISQSRSLPTRDYHRRYSSRRRSPPPAPPKYHCSHRCTTRGHRSSPHRRNTGVGKPGRCLFVAGFCFKTTERDLERKFYKFGRVRDVRIIRDKRSGDSRGFGFLSLERDEEADAAIRALDKTEWNGRVILVEKSKTS